jgi:hypothetical protein
MSSELYALDMAKMVGQMSNSFFTLDRRNNSSAPSAVMTVAITGSGLESYIQDLAEKNRIIHDLTERLNEFERKKSFAPSRHRLPLDYYDNDIYLDE